jgi:F-type H+-transporting ATPase subunit gamma
MSSRRELRQRLSGLYESREILNAMKNLAQMETLKLARHGDTQRRVIELIERAAADFLGFYGDLLSAEREVGLLPVYLLIGSERGFCGDFNAALLKALQAELSATADPAAVRWIVVGQRLLNRLPEDSRLLAKLDGANVTEEVPTVLQALIDLLNTLPTPLAALRLTVLHQSTVSDEVVRLPLLPPLRHVSATPKRFPHPPLLNLSPPDFFAELVDQYLFAVLHEILYLSLAAENHRRVEHMDGAVSYIDVRREELERKGRILRQEEITEEIEVILLSVAGPDQPALLPE